MARKKDPPAAILPLKFRFYEALDNYLHQSMMAMEAFEQALKLGAFSGAPTVESMLRERLEAMRKAWSSDNEEG